MARQEAPRRTPTPPEPDPEEVLGYVEPIEINLEMERSFLEYSMSVIVARALPDVRDGLKPVHRRILYSMFDQGLRPDRPYAKCAKVVGEVMGTYHPHGDTAIYDALVRMVQDFSMRHPLVVGPRQLRRHRTRRGRRGDALHRVPAGAPGPGDARRHRRGDRRLRAELRQLRPSSPRSCRRGSPTCWSTARQGIAVGMATKIPPHNLGEVIDATLHLIDAPRRRPPTT